MIPRLQLTNFLKNVNFRDDSSLLEKNETTEAAQKAFRKRSLSLSDLEPLAKRSKDREYLLLTVPGTPGEIDESKFGSRQCKNVDFKNHYKANTDSIPWNFTHCSLAKGFSYFCFPTNKGDAIKTKRAKLSTESYQSGLKMQQIVEEKITSSNQKLEIPPQDLRPLGQNTFYFFRYKNGLHVCKLNSLSHLERALLQDCKDLEFTSKEEVLYFCALLFRQVAALHENHIFHMDIKPGNTCKTENGTFKLIDLADSLDLSTMDGLRKLQVGSLSITSSSSHYDIIRFLRKENDLEDARAFAAIFDIFSIGSTIYQIAYGFQQGSSLGKCQKASPGEALPHNFIPNFISPLFKKAIIPEGFPCTLKDEKMLANTLKIFTPEQQKLLLRILSLELGRGTVDINKLIQAFPLIKPKK